MSETQKPYRVYKKIDGGAKLVEITPDESSVMKIKSEFSLTLTTITPDEPLPHTISDRITGVTGTHQPFKDTKSFSTHQEAKDYIKSLGGNDYIIIVDSE